MEKISDIWGASDKPGADPVAEQRLLFVMQQAAWSWLVDTVDTEYGALMTRLVPYSQQEASRKLREFLGIKILIWDKIMKKHVIIPDEFRDVVFEAKKRMEEWTR